MRILAHRETSGVAFGLMAGDRVRPIPDAVTLVEAWASVLAGRVGTDTVPADSLTLTNPVTPVRNIFCVGWNYTDHFAEGASSRASSAPSEIPTLPTFFTKATGTVIGPYDDIRLHADVTEMLDWEVELAVIVGRGGSDIDERSAIEHVLGFAVANDVSARDVQRAHGGQWFRGKSLDGTCPIGPWIVTPDELGPIGSRSITCRLNGETMQSASLGDLHFGVGRIIAELSRGLTLLPGDVILTGTPAGVGSARTPARFLARGDVVESEIDGIGTLRNVVGG